MARARERRSFGFRCAARTVGRSGSRRRTVLVGIHEAQRLFRPPPAAYGPQDVDPSHRFYFEHGFSGASEGENIAAGFATWQLADAAFMGERMLCPDDSAANCPFTETTGHFLNIVDAQYSWTGFGIVPPSATSSYYTEDFAEVWQTAPHVNSEFRRSTFAPGLRS
jgi:hypothetical protein